MLEQVLQYMERMFDFGAHAGLDLLQLFFGVTQRIFLHGLAHAALHRDVPGDLSARVLRALVGTLVSSVAKHHLFVAMKKIVSLRDVGHVACGGYERMRQPGFGIDADMGLHAEEPVLALFRLMHFRIAFFVAVFGRGRRCNQSRVDDSPLAHHQATAGQVPVDFIEDPRRQVVLLEQTAELEQCRCVRSRLVRQVNTDKAANGLAIVDRIFDALVRQAEALLCDVHAQHPLQTDRRTAASFSLGVVRQQRRHQRWPRRHGLDLSQKAIAPRQSLLACELGVGKTRLFHRDAGMMGCVIVPVVSAVGGAQRLNQRFPNLHQSNDAARVTTMTQLTCVELSSNAAGMTIHDVL
jgi:hypothetical protein